MWPGPLQVEWKSSPWRDMGGHCRAGMGLGEALKLPERGALGMPLERRHWPLCGLFSEASPTCCHDAATKGGQTCQHQGLAVPPPSEGPPEAPEAPEAFFLDAFDTHQCTPTWLFFHPSILPTSQRLLVK
ncbi:hypothetical protein VDGL01_12439 [Verticillium dahliae]